MARPKDSKNKPKNVHDLLEKVVAEYQKQGKKLSYNVEDLTGLTEVQKAEIEAATSLNPNLDIANIFELEDSEDNLYKCGKCHNDLEGEDAVCPYCGSTLRWQ